MYGRRWLLSAALCTPAIVRSTSLRANSLEPVDLELELAVDVSRSVDDEEMEMQFKGYAAAFRDQRLIESVMRGSIGSIAVTLYTWSDWNFQQHLIPWSCICDSTTAEQFACAIDAVPRRTNMWTSISAGIDFGVGLFGQGYEGTRRVIDVSGDGHNNSGRDVHLARNDAVSQGVIVNGLAVLDRHPPPVGAIVTSWQPLDEYYQENVIGGPGAFLMVADGFESFELAVRRKIVREVAGESGPKVMRTYA